MSKLYFYYGTMGSSKSAQLLMKAYSFEERGIGFICIKPSIDNRDGVDVIKSRIGLQRECIPFGINDNIFDFIKECIYNCEIQMLQYPKWVLVDESQFLTSEQVNQLAKVVDELDINVICYGLRGDFMTNTFEGSKRLFELADEINEMKISCSCGRKAVINARIDKNGEIIIDGEQIVIGGNESYIPLCRKCYYTALSKKNKC